MPLSCGRVIARVVLAINARDEGGLALRRPSPPSGAPAATTKDFLTHDLPATGPAAMASVRPLVQDHA